MYRVITYLYAYTWCLVIALVGTFLVLSPIGFIAGLFSSGNALWVARAVVCVSPFVALAFLLSSDIGKEWE